MASTGQSSQRAGQEAHSKAAPAAGSRRPVLYLLSSDDGLLIELGPLLGERYRTRPVDSAEQLEPAGQTSWAVLIDAATRADARALAARLEQQHPLAPLLIICADGAAADWAGARSRGMVSAVIERSALRAPAFIAALATVDRQLSSGAADASPANRPARTDAAPGRRRAWLLLALLLLAAAAAGWYLRRGGSGKHSQSTAPTAAAVHPAAPGKRQATPAPAPAAAAAASTPAATSLAVPTPMPTPERPVLELLSDARVAFREGKALLPRADEAAHGDSALELYLAVLAQEPQNEEARDGLRRLFAVARVRIQSDLGSGRLDQAGRLVAAFRGAGIPGDELAALETQIAAARPRWLVMQARAAIAAGDASTATQLLAQMATGGADRAVLAGLRHELEANNARKTLADLAARAHASIGAGALLNPEPDNAQGLVQAMQQLDRNHPLTLAAQRELQAALLARARSASRAAQFDQAQQLLNSAADYGNGAELAGARKQLQDDMQAAQNRATAAATATREAQQQAAATTSATTDYIRARPVTPITVAFPQPALEAGQHGYVIVEFMLSPRGKALDPRVIEADPSKVFDEAARQAVRSGRFDTTALTDPAKPQRARIRITFK